MPFEKRSLSPQALRILTGTATGTAAGMAGGYYLTPDDEKRTRNMLLGGAAGGVLGGLGGQGYHMYRSRIPSTVAAMPRAPEAPAPVKPQAPTHFGAGSPEPARQRPPVMDDAPELSWGPNKRLPREEETYLRRQALADLERAKREGFSPEGVGAANVLGAAALLKEVGDKRSLQDYPFARRMVKGAEFVDIEDQARSHVLAHYGLSKFALASPLSPEALSKLRSLYRRQGALSGGIRGGLLGGAIGLATSEEEDRLNNMLRGAGIGLVSGGALGAAHGHYLSDPSRRNLGDPRPAVAGYDAVGKFLRRPGRFMSERIDRFGVPREPSSFAKKVLDILGPDH